MIIWYFSWVLQDKIDDDNFGNKKHPKIQAINDAMQERIRDQVITVAHQTYQTREVMSHTTNYEQNYVHAIWCSCCFCRQHLNFHTFIAIPLCAQYIVFSHFRRCCMRTVLLFNFNIKLCVYFLNLWIRYSNHTHTHAWIIRVEMISFRFGFMCRTKWRKASVRNRVILPLWIVMSWQDCVGIYFLKQKQLEEKKLFELMHKPHDDGKLSTQTDRITAPTAAIACHAKWNNVMKNTIAVNSFVFECFKWIASILLVSHKYEKKMTIIMFAFSCN